MELVTWWLSAALLLAVVAAWFVLRSRHKKLQAKTTDTRLPLANSYRLTRLPEYQKYLRQYRNLIRGALVIAVISMLMIIILAGRPTTKSVIQPEMRNRDIVLCLDVSLSMIEVDAEILRIYAELSKGFKGERLSLVLFASSPVTVFPLTDDYEFITEQLQTAAKAFQDSGSGTYDSESSRRMYALLSGVYSGEGSSLIGDGLAGCVSRFDKLDSKRSRSIILGTDNELSGSPIVTLREAAEFAKDKDIRVYGLNPNDYSYKSKYSNYVPDTVKEFKEAMLLTNGDYYKMEDAAAASTIIAKVSEQEATRFKGTPQIVYSDQPQVFLIMFLIGFVGLMIISWRLRI